jgi:DNA-binding SARP family transcriptional activator
MRGQELLALLVLEKGIPRERIASRMWPDSTEAQARTNLRRELHQLRRTLYDQAVDDDGPALSLEDGIRSDVDDVREALARSATARGTPDELAALLVVARTYSGELVPECFAEWMVPVRERMRDDAVLALRRLTELLEQRRDFVEGIRWARRSTEIDPLDEIAYRAQMRLCAAASDRAAALHAFHRCTHLLERELGVEPAPETRALYRQLVENPVEQTAPQARAFVGREAERDRLLRAWRPSNGALQRAACIVGEPGIGKSRLAEEVARQAERDGARVARARAYAVEGQLSYAPIVEWLRSPAIAPHVADLDLPWRSEIAHLLPEANAGRAAPKPDALQDGDDAYRRRVLFEAVSRVLFGGTRPTVLVLDDLQWCDPETLAFLHYASRYEGGVPLYVVMTARSVELADNEAARRLLLALLQEGQLLEIELGPLAASDVAELVRAAGHSPTPEIAERLHALSEGNPLFALEALRANLHLGGNLLASSPRVRGVLTARLAQLGPRSRELAQFAATIGRAFDVDVLREAADLDESELVPALDELWQRRIVREHPERGYDFTHDALREAATLDLSPGRARLLHRRVAQAFELVHASRLDELGAELAAHYELAGLPDRATGYCRRAARAAVTVYAHDRAAALLERALALVAARPSSRQRDSEEVALLIERALSLRALLGYAHPKVLAGLERARTLAEGLDDASVLFQVLRNLWGLQFVAGDLKGTLETANRMSELASALPDVEAIGHHALAGALTHVGELGAAIDHFEAARDRYDPKDAPQHLSLFGSDLGVFNSAWAAHALWLHGLEDRAITSSNDAVQTARVLGHAYSEALAQAYAAVLHYMRRDRRACADASRAARELCGRYGFAYYGHWGTILGAWAESGDPAAAATAIRGALAALDAEGSWARRPIYLAALAEVLSAAGREREAIAALDQAENLAATSGDRVWSAELVRLRAVLVPECEKGALESARRALALATELRARPLVVRSAVTLAGMMVGQKIAATHILREALADLPDSGSSFDRDRAMQMLRTLDHG